MTSEFSIIKKFFQRKVHDKDVIVGSGDDCAIVRVPENYELALSIDTMVLNTHFTDKTPPFDVGYKSVTSSVSDLAAMGAMPKWLTGSLTLPNADEQWLENFSEGLFAAVEEYNMTLIGGDLSRGPLTITMQVHGVLPVGSAILRSGAQLGDLIYVTNTLGDAAYGLTLPNGNTALHRPKAQIAAGLVMREFANSCIDISDGLLQDLQHILNQSQVGAKIYLEQILLSKELQALDREQALQFALSGGEDYQLLMTIPKQQQVAFEKAMPAVITCIGEIRAGNNLLVLDAQGKQYSVKQSGYDHFL